MAEPTKGFDDIKFTAEESGSLNTDQSTEDPKPAPEKDTKEVPEGGEAPAEELTDAQKKEKDADPDSGAEEPSEDQEALIEYEGKSYTLEALTEAIKDSQNKKSWQETNTQKAQTNADDRKLLDGFVDVLTKLKNSDSEFKQDTLESIREIVGEDVYDKAMGEIEGYSNSYKDQIAERDTENNDLKNELALVKGAKELRKNNPGLTEDQAEEVVNFAIDKFVEDGVALPLDDAYKLWNYDKVKAKAKVVKKKAKVPKSPPAGPGASDIKEKQKSKSNNPFDDIVPDGEKLFES